MTVRTSMELRERVEITFSFDTEEEANAWVQNFQAASACYNEKAQAERTDTGKTNRPVPKPSGSGSVENKTPKKKSSLIL